jgi:hypothetical protein
MMSQSNVEQLIQKTRRYEYADGLRDLQLAALFGFGGLAAWIGFEPFWLRFIGYMVKTFGRWAAWVGMLPVVLMPLAVWGMVRVMDILRRRWLWRESGMVKPSRWIVPRRINVISTVILLGGIAIGLGLRQLGWVEKNFILHMLWTATGWSFGYTLFAMGRDIDLRRYLWLGVIGGVLSTVMLFLPLSFGMSSLVFGLIWFFLLTTSGMLTLRAVALTMKRES